MARPGRLAMAAALLIVVAACQSNSPSGSPNGSGGQGSPSASAAGGGGNLVITGPWEPDTLTSPIVGVESKYDTVMRNVFQTLVARDSTDYGQLVPELALSWTNPEPTKWVFELRQGVTFHDGSKFDAAAAAASLTADYEATVLDTGSFIGPPATFKATGDFTLEMTTKEPDPIVPSRMTMIPITSAEQLVACPDCRTTKPIGTGPYEFVSWNKGSEMDLKLNQQSWLAKPGMFDTIQWLFRAEASVRAQMVQTGEADVTYGLTTDQCSSGSVTCRVQSTIVMYILRIDDFNQTLLGDNRVRRAIAMAIDRKSIADTFLAGVPVSDNAVPNGSIGYDESVPGYQFDLAAAKDLLAQAKAAGIDTSLPVHVKYVGGFVPDDNVSLVIQQNLKALGLNADVAAIPLDKVGSEFVWNTSLQKEMPKDRGDIWFLETGDELLDFTPMGGQFLVCGSTDSAYCQPDLDKQYQAALSLGGDARDTAFKQIWAQAYADVAVLPIAPVSDMWAFSDRIDVPTRPDGILPLWLVTPK
jgi:peptide/nickel transport system substrate-binding protein